VVRPRGRGEADLVCTGETRNKEDQSGLKVAGARLMS
jgi:hypothetical protein